jgi:aminopeptidase
MKQAWIDSYAKLLANYCLDIQPGDKVFVQSTFLAEPLLKAFYRESLRAGGLTEFSLQFSDKEEIFYEEANDAQLKFVSPSYQNAMEHFDVFLNIRAPYTLINKNLDKEKFKLRSEASKPVLQTYFRRTGNGEMRRSLCQYPTQVSAEMAGMTLSEYSQFIAKACKLTEPDPVKAWLHVREKQQHYVDYLDNVKTLRYQSDKMDIEFSVAGRKWINSDGRNNMPSGEVFSAPVEDSVQGYAFFDYPALYLGQEISGIYLEVKDGYVEKWSAESGGEILDQLFSMEGARRFGEVAIGTNYDIDRSTGNILFDEKIGGTIHMAVGQSYAQCGGKNESAIHLDLIAGMQAGGSIYADGLLIYENGFFTI